MIKSDDEESGQEGEADSNENNSGQKAGKVAQKERKKKEKKEKKVRVEVTPAVVPKEKNIQVATRLAVVPEAKKPVQNNREKNEQHSLTISEAFADDDVIEEFRAEKVRLFFSI